MFDSFFNSIFTPLLSFSPFWTVFLIAFTISLVITVIYKFATDQRLMKELKTDMKMLQKEMKELKDHPEKIVAKQKLAMQKNMEYMKHSMKPTLITMVPLLLIFGWLRTTFTESGDLITWSFSVPLFGTGIGWLGIYILSAIFFSMTLRKLLKIH